MVDKGTIDTMCKLLDSYGSDDIASELQNTSDVELLLNFLLAVCILSLGYFGLTYLSFLLATPRQQPNKCGHSQCKSKS